MSRSGAEFDSVDHRLACCVPSCLATIVHHQQPDHQGNNQSINLD